MSRDAQARDVLFFLDGLVKRPLKEVKALASRAGAPRSFAIRVGNKVTVYEVHETRVGCLAVPERSEKKR